MRSLYRCPRGPATLAALSLLILLVAASAARGAERRDWAKVCRDAADRPSCELEVALTNIEAAAEAGDDLAVVREIHPTVGEYCMAIDPQPGAALDPRVLPQGNRSPLARMIAEPGRRARFEPIYRAACERLRSAAEAQRPIPGLAEAIAAADGGGLDAIDALLDAVGRLGLRPRLSEALRRRIVAPIEPRIDAWLEARATSADAAVLEATLERWRALTPLLAARPAPAGIAAVTQRLDDARAAAIAADTAALRAGDAQEPAAGALAFVRRVRAIGERWAGVDGAAVRAALAAAREARAAAVEPVVAAVEKAGKKDAVAAAVQAAVLRHGLEEAYGPSDAARAPFVARLAVVVDAGRAAVAKKAPASATGRVRVRLLAVPVAAPPTPATPKEAPPQLVPAPGAHPSCAWVLPLVIAPEAHRRANLDGLRAALGGTCALRAETVRRGTGRYAEGTTGTGSVTGCVARNAVGNCTSVIYDDGTTTKYEVMMNVREIRARLTGEILLRWSGGGVLREPVDVAHVAADVCTDAGTSFGEVGRCRAVHEAAVALRKALDARLAAAMARLPAPPVAAAPKAPDARLAKADALRDARPDAALEALAGAALDGADVGPERVAWMAGRLGVSEDHLRRAFAAP